MFNTSQVLEWSRPRASDGSYPRPFLIHKNNRPIEVALVGKHPATGITTEHISKENYSELLLDYTRFQAFYNEVRKNKPSRTRIGIDALSQHIIESLQLGVIEMYSNLYPQTDTSRHMKSPDELDPQCVFMEVLLCFQPKLLIFYHREALETALKWLHECQIIPEQSNLNYPFKVLEYHSPIVEFRYPKGTLGHVLVCRPLFYYGKNGKTFEHFRNKLEWVVGKVQ